MDVFEFDTMNAEKVMAMRKYKMTDYAAKLFRCFEAFVLLLFLFPWFSSRLPAAARASGDYFVQFVHILEGQKFVFIVGNAIVITLLAKSGRFGRRCLSGDLYDEFIRNSEYTHAASNNDDIPVWAVSPPRVEEKKDTVFEDKSVCTEDRTREADTYRRSVSEKQVDDRKVDWELRRSETKKSFEETKPAVSAWSYDESHVSVLSNDEFRRTIDAFIAKQIQFRRQEAMAFVVQTQSNSD